MNDLEIITTEQIRGKTSVLFSIGDVDVQNALWQREGANAILQKIDAGLRLSTILYDINIHSPSYYFESRFSRKAYSNHKGLFTSENNNLFALSSEAEDYFAHLEKKRKLCPNMPQYKGLKAEKYARQLQSLGTALHREGDISQRIEELWLEDIAEKDGAKLDSDSLDTMLLENFRDPAEDEKYRAMLRRVVEKRNDLELVKSYVTAQLRCFPRPLLPFVTHRLLYFYLKSCSDTLGIDLMDINGTRLYNGMSGVSKQNIPLFALFLQRLGIYEPIKQMTDYQLLEFKKREEFINVRSTYLAIVDQAKTMQENELRLRWETAKDAAKVKYAEFSGIFKKVSQVLLLVCLSNQLPPIESASFSLLPPELLDWAIRRLAHIERTPLNDLKSVVLEQYGDRLSEVDPTFSRGVVF